MIFSEFDIQIGGKKMEKNEDKKDTILEIFSLLAQMKKELDLLENEMYMVVEDLEDDGLAHDLLDSIEEMRLDENYAN